jgi:sec-independent protein translocase protein TatA
MILGFGMPGPTEMFLILIVVLVLFGAKKIPELARSLGKATREFKEAKSAFNDAVHDEHEQPVNKANIAPPMEDEELEVDSKETAEATPKPEDKK